MSYAAEGNKNTAQRIYNAHVGFVQSLMELGELTEKQAIAVKDLYIKNKLVKLDAVGGSLNVKHGAYLDKDVLQRAAALNA